MKFFYSLSVGLSLLLTGCTPAAGALSQLKQALAPTLDPLGMNESYQRRLINLPLNGQAADSDLPWSDSHWPSQSGGIAHRWQIEHDREDREDEGFDYELKTFEQLSRAEKAELQNLSPAEKFDIYNGRYDFPTVKAEWQRTSPEAEMTESLSHGWAAAALNYREPAAIVVSNEDDIELEFGSSDIKALLSYYQGQVAYSRTTQLGERCRVEFERFSEKSCQETNAGAFHLILANELGRSSQGFVMNVTIDGEIHNYPVHAYMSVIEQDHRLPLPSAALGTVKSVEIKTTVSFSTSADAHLDATNGTPQHKDLTVVYHYVVDLDAKGLVIGGSWIGKERPDVLWRQDRPLFDKDFAKLQNLYEAATQ